MNMALVLMALAAQVLIVTGQGDTLDCCSQVMLTFPGGQAEATNTTSITFNVTELGVDSGSSPKYQFGDYCLEEKEELVDSVSVFFWQVTECETGKLIIWFEGSTIPQCMEDVLVGDWAAEGNDTILLKPTVFCDGVAIVDGATEAGPEASGTTIEDVNTTAEEGTTVEDSQTDAATDAATDSPTDAPTDAGTDAGTDAATDAPTDVPTDAGTDAPTDVLTDAATDAATDESTAAPTDAPTAAPTDAPTNAATDAATDAATEASTGAATDAATDATINAPTGALTDAPTEASTSKPCEPCRNVEEGRLAGFYQLQSSTDRRCDNGCSYTNWNGAEFCFEEGGFKTSLECQDESLEVNL